MLNLVVSGVKGKMGQAVVASAIQSGKFNVIAGIDRSDDPNFHIPIYKNPDDIKEKIDVIVDFSIPEATVNVVEFARKNSIPIVIATTGLSQSDMLAIEGAAFSIPIFKSGNMSLGINLMIKLVTESAKTLNDDYDIEILEKHHNKKIDAPSGTAYLLADNINEALNNKYSYNYNRHNIKEKRDNNEIGIHSIRGGTVVGEHSVFFYGDNEVLEIKHTVTSRSIFANGALKAAEFIVNKENGIYSMKDLV